MQASGAETVVDVSPEVPAASHQAAAAPESAAGAGTKTAQRAAVSGEVPAACQKRGRGKKAA